MMPEKVPAPLLILAAALGLGLGAWLLLTPDSTASARSSTQVPSSPQSEPEQDACLACTARVCRAHDAGCSTLQGTASDGPGRGQEKKALCEAVLSCVERTGCGPGAEGVGHECYCGSAKVDDCIAGSGGAGPCVKEIEAAAESTQPLTIGQRWGQAQFALGTAFGRMRCQAQLCKTECATGQK